MANSKRFRYEEMDARGRKHKQLLPLEQFPNVHTADIWGRIVLWGGDCPVHWRVLSSIPGFHPLDASSSTSSLVMTTQTCDDQKWSPDTAKYLLGILKSTVMQKYQRACHELDHVKPLPSSQLSPLEMKLASVSPLALELGLVFWKFHKTNGIYRLAE